MNLFVMIWRVVGLALGLVLMCGVVQAQEKVGRVKLPDADQYGVTLRRVQALDSNGLLCVTGSHLVDDETKIYALIYVVDQARGRVLWHKRLAGSDGAIKNVSVDCRMRDAAIFLLTNVDKSYSYFSAHPQYATVYKFDMAGRLLGTRQVAPLKYQDSAFAYGFGESEGKFYIVGMEFLRDDEHSRATAALYSVPMNSDLSFGKALERETGAYGSLSAMRILGGDIFISGRFSPHVEKLDEDKDYQAASRIRLNGKYVWSTKLDPTDDLRAFVADSGVQYLLDSQDHKSVLSRLNADGKPAGRVAYTSRYCGADGLVVAADRLFALRSLCAKEDSEAHQLVSIDASTGAEKPLSTGDLKPEAIASLPDGLGVIGRDAKAQRYLFTLPATALQP